MQLSIIIVSYNTKEILRKCLKIVYENIGNLTCEVIVADNASHDGSPEMVELEFPQVCLIRCEMNYGFGKANNIAMRKAKGTFFLLLNSDAFIKPGILEKTLNYMNDNPDVGVLGVKMVGEEGNLQPSARKFPTPFYKFTVLSGISSRFPNSRLLGGPDYSWWDHNSIKNVDWVVGAYLMVRSDAAEQVGYFDERYFLYYEETDFCLQIKKKGYNVIFYPFAEVIHLGGESSKNTDKAVSESGRQITGIRIDSEQKYHWKNYGWLRVYSIVYTEVIWNYIVIVKNSILKNTNSKTKIKNARQVIDLHKKSMKNKNYRNTSYNYEK